jgi:carboxynorspermidine decarboxylase
LPIVHRADDEHLTACLSRVETPALVIRLDRLVGTVGHLRAETSDSRLEILYSIKACGLACVLEALRLVTHGFSVASPAEAEIAARLMDSRHTIHLTSPGLRESWMDATFPVTHLAFNSISQWQRLRAGVPAATSLGIRVNPGRSLVDDPRHDPARRHSKLGVPIDELGQILRSNALPGVAGIHVHTSYLGKSFEPLLATAGLIADRLLRGPTGIRWINLGGGYVWDSRTDFAPLRAAVSLLRDDFGVRVFFEPGAGVVRAAGSLVSQVIDLFVSQGKQVAVLDTTVNHLPQVFEYQQSPEVVEHAAGAAHQYILAGCSCLAGDVFGEYAFAEKLAIGSRVTFADVGAYSLVKAHMFNGINLPQIYYGNNSGELVLFKRFTSRDYASFCGVDCHTKISPLCDTDKSPE